MRRLHGLSLHHRLLLAALLPAVLIAAVVASVVLESGTRALNLALRDRAQAIVSFLAPAAEYGVISGNRDGLQPLLRAAMAQRDVTGAAVYDDQGRLLASSGHVDRLEGPILGPVDGPRIVEVSPRTLGGLAPVMATPLAIDDIVWPTGHNRADWPRRPVGWVYVELDTRPALREKAGIIAATIGLVLAGLAGAAVLASRLALSVARPVARLATAVGEMSSGKLDVHLPEHASATELAALERGFNAMARSIADMHRTMQSRIDAATAQLAHQAHHDPLTGLPNRRVFEQTLEETVAASRRASDHGALCFIDLDRFKIVNDTCGHGAGDELLRHIAHLIKQRVREQDVVCRVGGDEFALILRDCSRDDAMQVAESLREAVSAFRFAWEDRRFSVGASIGLVPIDGSHPSPADVLLAADLACYAAKKSGRNRVVEHAPGAHGLGENDAGTAELDLDTADLHRRLEIHAQTIVPLDVMSDNTWLELLLRLRDENGEIHLPGDYLAHLTETDDTLELDAWMAERACAIAAQLDAQSTTPRSVMVSLNLSRAAVLAAPSFLARLQQHIEAHGIVARQLVIELGAATLEQLPGESMELAQQVRAIGCKLILQQLDGGIVRHLSALRPDYVKISVSGLVAAYGLEAGCNLAQALAGMAATLGITTIASEVEDPLLLDMLHSYGFAFAQGYAVSPPLPIESRDIESPLPSA